MENKQRHTEGQFKLVRRMVMVRKKTRGQEFLQQLRLDELRRFDAMWDAFGKAYTALEDKSGIYESWTRLDGFDANNDEEYQFLELVGYRDHGYNSHGSRLHLYRGLLRRWESTPNRDNLSAEDFRRIMTPPQQGRW